MNPFDIFFEDGTIALRCANRRELKSPHAQSRLAWIAEKGLKIFCKCRGGLLQLVLACEDGVWITRAWPGEKENHADTCGAVGDSGDSDDASGDGSSAAQAEDKPILPSIDRAFSEAYARQFAEPPGSPLEFCRWIDMALKPTLQNFHPDWQWCASALVDNPPAEGPARNKTVKLSVRRLTMKGEQEVKEWEIPVGIRFSGRTHPDGSSLRGLHVLTGIFGGTPNRWHAFHAWPVVENRGFLHGTHSDLELRFLGRLGDDGYHFLKPPSADFLGKFQHPDWPEIPRLLAERGIWPDAVVRLPDGRFCVIEVAGLENAAYLRRILDKIELLKEFESTHGIEWAIVRPEGTDFTTRLHSAGLRTGRFALPK